VAEAVEEAHPDRAADIYVSVANAIAAETKPKTYPRAGALLKHVRSLLEKSGREQDWPAIIEDFWNEHRRKWRLMKVLDGVVAASAIDSAGSADRHAAARSVRIRPSKRATDLMPGVGLGSEEPTGVVAGLQRGRSLARRIANVIQPASSRGQEAIRSTLPTSRWREEAFRHPVVVAVSSIRRRVDRGGQSFVTSQSAVLPGRVIEPDEARTAGHQHVLLVMAQTFDVDGATVLCEPSIVGQRSGVPDLVVVDPYSGVHVIEVKAVTLDAVRSVQPGGAIEIEYDSGRRRDPVKQARNAMFDIRDVASRHFGGDLNAVFEHWVVFPQIERDEWEAKFGELIAGRRDVLFRDDLESSGLVGRLRERATSRLGGGDANGGTLLVPPKQMDSQMAAVGDSAVLAPVDPAPPVAASEGSLGEHLADRHGEYRALTEQQQRLASQDWNEGPRLVRRVAGSGKTVVLAAQMARMLARRPGETRSLFEREGERPVRILAVCFNRTLVPFIRERIEAA